MLDLFALLLVCCLHYGNTIGLNSAILKERYKISYTQNVTVSIDLTRKLHRESLEITDSSKSREEVKKNIFVLSFVV
jgi:hypothetical protein